MVRPVLITKTDQPFDVVWDTNYFFGNTLVSTSMMIWMMLLLRSGDNAMISDAAAITTLIIAMVEGSIGWKIRSQNYSSDLALTPLFAFRDHPVVLYGHFVKL